MSKAKILSLLSQRGSKKLADQTKREAMDKANLRDMINEDPSLAKNLDDKEFQDLMDDISDPSSMRGDTFASEDYENTLRMIKDMSPEDVAKQIELFGFSTYFLLWANSSPCCYPLLVGMYIVRCTLSLFCR